MAVREVQACLLLGSNVNPEKNLPEALRLLQGRMVLKKSSSVWKSPAVGSSGPDFLNAALLMETGFSANQLKEEIIRPLEAELGRVRTEDKNAPRTIDIDLIIYDRQLIDISLWQMAHIAVPVAELLPDFRSESGARLEDVAYRLKDNAAIRLCSSLAGYPFSIDFTEL